MPRYKPVDRSPKFIPVVLSEQLQPGTFEFTLDHLIDHELTCLRSMLDSKTIKPEPQPTTHGSC